MAESIASNRPAVDADTFRTTLGRWASGVTIVTAQGERGPVGITASAFSSLSLEPPLVLVCVGTHGSSHDDLVSADAFAIHMLGESESDLSARFASAGEDKFGPVSWSPGPLGAPLLNAGIARIVCEHHAGLPHGDHTILVGRVMHVETSPGHPLLYWSGDYRALQEDRALR